MIRELFAQLGNLFTWVVVVAPWEQALRIRGGKTSAHLMPGVYLRIPFWDRVYRQSIRRRAYTMRAMVLTTRDGKTISVNGTVLFEIGDMQRLYNSVQHPEPVIDAECSLVIAQHIVTHDYVDCDPGTLTKIVEAGVDMRRYGITNVSLFISNFLCAKTYRMVTGEIMSWSAASPLNVDDHVQHNTPH